MSCETCPLRGRPRVDGTGTRGGLAVVGDAPSPYEVREKRPFAGTAGEIMRQSLTAAGLDTKDIWFTCAVACSPPRGEKVTQEAIDCCRGRLIEELAGMTRILISGSTALESLGPEFGKITALRGIGLRLNTLPCDAVVTMHPASILSDPFVFPDLVKDLEKFVSPEPFRFLTLPSIHFCQTIEDVKKAISQLRQGDITVVDLETTDLDPLLGEIIVLGMQSCLETCWQIPQTLLKKTFVRRLLNDFLTDPSVVSAAHNIGFDAKFVQHELGILWRPQIDTMLLHYVLDERSRDEDDSNSRSGNQSIHGLKTLVRERFNVPDYDEPLKSYLKTLSKTRHLEARRLKKLDQETEFVETNYGDVPLEILSPYLAQDTLYTYVLAHDLVEEARAEGTLKVHDEILIPAAIALLNIELTGVLIDVDSLLQVDERLESEIEQDMIELRQYAEDDDFSVNSPKQVANLLYDKLRLLGGKKGPTDKEALSSLIDRHPAVSIILECRQKERIRGTYIRGLKQRISSDGRLRGEFLLHGTKTGRLSSRNPNLQNIPVLIGPIIRNAFISTPGWTMIEADYSQLELRVAAWYSHDERLLQYYRDGVDVHRMVASEVFDVPPEQVTQMQRYIAKYIDFGILYGRGAASLAKNELNCPVSEAQTYIDSFLGKFDGLRTWMLETQNRTIETGYVESGFGRRRRFPFISPQNEEEIRRQSVNSPIQSLASDLCLTALTRLQSRLDPEKARILLTVHDSILFEARDENLDETLEIIRAEMEDNCRLETEVKFEVDIKVGRSWGQLDKRNN